MIFDLTGLTDSTAEPLRDLDRKVSDHWRTVEKSRADLVPLLRETAAKLRELNRLILAQWSKETDEFDRVSDEEAPKTGVSEFVTILPAPTIKEIWEKMDEATGAEQTLIGLAETCELLTALICGQQHIDLTPAELRALRLRLLSERASTATIRVAEARDRFVRARKMATGLHLAPDAECEAMAKAGDAAKAFMEAKRQLNIIEEQIHDEEMKQ